MKHLFTFVSALALALILHPGCSANQGNIDANSLPADEDAGTTGDGKIEGCDWAAGDWDFSNCNAQTVFVELKLDGCEIDVESTSQVYDGGTGLIRDSAVFLSLPTGDTCHAYWDGSKLEGACGTALTVCAITALKR